MLRADLYATVAVLLLCHNSYCQDDSAHSKDVFLMTYPHTIKIRNELKKFLNSNAEWRNIKDPNLSVAVRWCKTMKSVPIDQPASLIAAQRFAGFVEGKYSIHIPEWWVKYLAKARRSQNYGVQIHPVRGKRIWKEDSGWYLSGLSNVKFEDDRLLISCKNRAPVSLGREQLSVMERGGSLELTTESIKPCVAGGCTDEFLYIAFHGTLEATSSPRTLFAVDLASGQVMWRGVLFTGEWLASSGFNPETSYSEVAISDSHVSVFGIQSQGLYVNVLDRANGELKFVFSTLFYANHEISGEAISK